MALWKQFGDLVNEVLNFGFNDGPQVNKRRIEQWINEGQQMISRQVECPEFQVIEPIELKALIGKYALPSNFLRIQDVMFPEQQIRLTPVDLWQYDQIGIGEGFPTQLNGPPEYYTIYKEEMLVFPIPSGAGESLQLRYFKKPAAMESETSVPELNKDYWYLLVEYAIVRGFEAEDDPEMSAQHLNRYKTDLDQFASDVQFRSGDRPMVVDGHWGGMSRGLRGVI